MSGIVGIVNLDGASVDEHPLRQLTQSLAFRGPDAQQVWMEGPVGLGHALLRITPEKSAERQPTTLDGRVWITADARVDSRAEVVSKLQSRGIHVSLAATDAHLILHAYSLWGEQCTDHLLGDFGFGIWDSRRRLLFCARDHFGIKPFYYARVGRVLIFSNTLNCIRMYPGVSNDLNDLAVADFLLFGFNKEPSTTTFLDIHRLPAAHYLVCCEGSTSIKRYWTLPVDSPIRYRRMDEYVENFRHVLSAAVEDRLPSRSAGVFMSGGLDSSSVATVAKDVCSRRSADFDLRAHTVVYDHLIPDVERHYSGLVVKALGIPIHYLVADQFGLFEGWERPEICGPEPSGDPLRAVQIEHFRQAASRHRVVLTGEAGDPALQPSVYYFLNLTKRLRFDRIAWELGRCAILRRGLPRVGFRTHLRRWMYPSENHDPYPAWLNPSFECRLSLRDRWEEMHRGCTWVHPARPEAYASLSDPHWQWDFENYDSGGTSVPIDVRHPIFDLRVVRFLLALPPVPWSVDKLLLRETMKGTLPEEVRLRAKTPVSRDPLSELLQRAEARWANHFQDVPALFQYVKQTHKDMSRNSPTMVNIRPLCLNFWLQTLSRIEYKQAGEERYEAAR